MGLLMEVTPFLKTIPTISKEEISNIKTKNQLVQVIKKNNLTNVIPLGIQLKYNFIILKKELKKYIKCNKDYLTLEELIRNIHNVNWSYSNDNILESSISKLNSNYLINIEEFNIKEIAIYNIYSANVSYDNLIEDFKTGKLQDDILFNLLGQSLKSFYDKNNALELMVEVIRYCYENGDKVVALYNMACLSVLVVEFNMSVKKGDKSFFCDKGIDCEIVISDGSSLGTYCHELGHAIYFKLKNEKKPTDVKKIFEELLKKNIDSVAKFIKNLEKYYYYIILKEIRSLFKDDKIYHKLLDLKKFLSEEEYLSLDKDEYQNRLRSIFDCLFYHNNSHNFDINNIIKLDSVVSMIEDLLSGLYLDNYTSNGFGLNYFYYHPCDYYYDIDLEIVRIDVIFNELFANYNKLRMVNQKIPLELVQLLGDKLFLNLISIYENIPIREINIMNYVTKNSIITEEVLEYPVRKLNIQYFEHVENQRNLLRLDNFGMISVEHSRLIRQYGDKEGNKIFFEVLLNYYKRNVLNFDTKFLENLASYSDGEIIYYINEIIDSVDISGNPIFNKNEKDILEKRRDEVLYDRARELKEEGLLGDLLYPYALPGEVYNNKLFEVDEGYLDYNSSNISEIEYYRKYIDRFNIEYFINITLEDNSIVTQMSSSICEMLDDEYDITRIKKIFITKDQKKAKNTEEDGILVFRYDESIEAISQRLYEQCKKLSKKGRVK